MRTMSTVTAVTVLVVLMCSHTDSPHATLLANFSQSISMESPKQVRLGETELIILEPGGGGSQAPSPPTA